MGPLVGTRLYPDRDAPFYITGMAVCSVAMAVVSILALALRIVLRRENAKRSLNGSRAEGKALVGEGRRSEFVYMT